MININITNLQTRLASTTKLTKIERLKSSNLSIVLEILLRNKELKPMHIAHFLMGKIALEKLELSEEYKTSIIQTDLIQEHRNCFSRGCYISYDIATTLKKDILKSGEYFGSWTESSEKTLDKLNCLSRYLKTGKQVQQGIENKSSIDNTENEKNIVDFNSQILKRKTNSENAIIEKQIDYINQQINRLKGKYENPKLSNDKFGNKNNNFGSSKFSRLSTAKDILRMKEELANVKEIINSNLDEQIQTINELKRSVSEELNNHHIVQDERLLSFRKIMKLIFAPDIHIAPKQQTMTYMVGGMFEKGVAALRTIPTTMGVLSQGIFKCILSEQAGTQQNLKAINEITAYVGGNSDKLLGEAAMLLTLPVRELLEITAKLTDIIIEQLKLQKQLLELD